MYQHVVVYGAPGVDKKAIVDNQLLRETGSVPMTVEEIFRFQSKRSKKANSHAKDSQATGQGSQTEDEKLESSRDEEEEMQDMHFPMLRSAHHVELSPSVFGYQDSEIVQEVVVALTSHVRAAVVDAGQILKPLMVVIRDAHKLSVAAQEGLRRVLEKCTTAARFWFVTDNICVLHPALRSRLVGKRVASPVLPTITLASNSSFPASPLVGPAEPWMEWTKAKSFLVDTRLSSDEQCQQIVAVLQSNATATQRRAAMQSQSNINSSEPTMLEKVSRAVLVSANRHKDHSDQKIDYLVTVARLAAESDAFRWATHETKFQHFLVHLAELPYPF